MRHEEQSWIRGPEGRIQYKQKPDGSDEARPAVYEERVSQEDLPRQGEKRRLALEVFSGPGGPARRKTKAPFGLRASTVAAASG